MAGKKLPPIYFYNLITVCFEKANANFLKLGDHLRLIHMKNLLHYASARAPNGYFMIENIFCWHWDSNPRLSDSCFLTSLTAQRYQKHQSWKNFIVYWAQNKTPTDKVHFKRHHVIPGTQYLESVQRHCRRFGPEIQHSVGATAAGGAIHCGVYGELSKD